MGIPTLTGVKIRKRRASNEENSRNAGGALGEEERRRERKWNRKGVSTLGWEGDIGEMV